MPTPALLLLIATLLPLLGFVILLFLGKKMGTPLAGWIGTAMIGGSFVCSLVALMVWINVSKDSPWGYEQGPINLPYHWIPVGEGVAQRTPGFLDIGIYVDSLTIAMFAMI